MTTTNGHVPDAKAATAPTVELGSTGLEIFGGLPSDEFHRKLRGNRAYKTYREMLDNDAIIGAMVFALTMTIRELNWQMVPAEGEGIDEAKALEVAARVQGALHDMSTSWPQTVDAILTFMPFGWSFFETPWKVCRGPQDPDSGVPSSEFDDGWFTWRKFAYRDQTSLVRWKFAEDGSGGIEAMVQRVDGKDVELPIDNALLFRTTTAKGNPEGRSILRNAYRPWRFKKRIEEIEGVGIERDLAGLPVAGIPPSFMAPDATPQMKEVYEKVKTLVSSIRRDDQDGVVFPHELTENGQEKWYLKLLSTGGQRQFDTNKIISRYNLDILLTVLADIILIGHESVGSFSLAETRQKMFAKTLTAFADEVATVVNQYGTPRLLRYNGVDPHLKPTLTHDEIDEADVEKLAKLLHEMFGAGMELDEPLENHLRALAKLPPKDPALQEA